MNASTAVATRQDQPPAQARPIDTVRAALEKMKPQLAMALPRHLTPDRLLRVAMSAIQNTPKLLECDRTSLYSAIMTCAQLGLEPDGVLGQAYLIPYGNKVQFIPGYRGLIALARNSGEVLSIQAHEVCERDTFTYRFGLRAELDHVPAAGDRGAVTHFWAMAEFKGGGNHWDVMTKAEVDAIRDGSQGYRMAKRFAKDGVVNSPWVQHYVEMGKKTAVRRIAKYLPMSVQKAAALADAYDGGRHGSIDEHGEIVIADAQVETTAGRDDAPRQTALDRFEKGDVTDAETVASGDAQPAQAPPASDPPAAAHVSALDAYAIAVPKGRDGRPNYLEWTNTALALLNGARTADEVEQTIAANLDVLDAMEDADKPRRKLFGEKVADIRKRIAAEAA